MAGQPHASDAIELLLSEAFADTAAGDLFRFLCRSVDVAPWERAPELPSLEPQDWFETLLQDGAPLAERVSRPYFAERQGRAARESLSEQTLARGVADVVEELSDRGYFPDALPRYCPDEHWDRAAFVARARRAIGLEFDWATPTDVEWSEDVIYSLIEYFHDEARRPRYVERYHSFGQCGPHYGGHVAASGAVVFRWRMNELLERLGCDYRLATEGEDRGRLVRAFGAELDGLAERAVSEATGPSDEVAEAVAMFRRRGANVASKRAALALLAGHLEPRRSRLRANLSNADEQDLFNIANNWAIRHRNANQRTDVGDEFLEWLFWCYLAANRFLDQVEARDGRRE